MRRVVKSQTGVGSSAWIPVDHNNLPCNIGFAVSDAGGYTYTVEHTYDDVFNPLITPLAFPHPTIAAQTTSKDGNYMHPISGIRLTISVGAGTATLTVLMGLKG